jgi:protein TonB
VAAQRRIEGWVIVEFNISVVGRVKDAKVVSAEPPRIFDREALRAIRKWKYKPKVENGVAVERKGIRVKLTFTLDNTS